VRKRVLGPEHPQTLSNASNLAAFLSEQGKYAEAEVMQRELLAVQKRVLGPEHPHTLTSANNLATSLSKQGKYAEAEHLLQATLESFERILGPAHPIAVQIATNLDHSKPPTKRGGKAAARRAAAPALLPTTLAEAEASARAAEAELLAMLDLEEPEAGAGGRSGSGKGKAREDAKGKAKGKGGKDGKVIKSVPVPVGSSTSIHPAADNAGVVANTSPSSTLQTNVSADCVVRALVEETSQTRYNAKSADSQSNMPSSMYDVKPESTNATPDDDTQIMAAHHMDVTLEGKKWIFGIVALVVLAVAGIVVLLVVNSRSRLVAKENYDF
jgi:hypothetical protein